MIEITIGKTRYIIGLQWVDGGEEPQITLEGLAERTRGEALDYVKITAKERTVIGYAPTPIDRKKGGKPFSLAASLARRGENAAYVIKIDDDSYWYCAIAEGLVITSTDRTASLEEVNAILNDLRSVVSAVYVQEPIDDLAIRPAEKTVEEILRGVRPVVIQRYRQQSESFLQLIFAVGAFVGALAFAWFFVFRDQKPEALPQTAKTPEQIRAEYIARIRAEMGNPVGDVDAVGKWLSAIDRLPDGFLTMQRTSFGCRGGSGCVALYTKLRGDTPSTGMPVGSVVDASGNRTSQTVNVPVAMLYLTDDEIASGIRTALPLFPVGEVVGRLGAIVPTLATSTEYQVRQVGATIPPEQKPPGAVPLRFEQLVVSISRGWDRKSVMRVDRWLVAHGFRAQEMELTWDVSGNAVTNGRARITYLRIYR